MSPIKVILGNSSPLESGKAASFKESGTVEKNIFAAVTGQKNRGEEEKRRKAARENVEEVRSMAGILQEGMESELAVPCRLRHHRNPHHQVLPRSNW